MTQRSKQGKRKKNAELSCQILTPRQVQIIRFIHEFRKSNGCSPTMQEMAQEFHISKVTVFEHVETLVGKGLLSRQPNKARSLILTAQGRSFLPELCNAQRTQQRSPTHDGVGSKADFPLVGYIAAGTPLEAIEGGDVLELGSLFDTYNQTFALCVRGDSMTDEHICDGDYVLIRRCQTAGDGEIVVATLENGEATLKKLFREGNRYRLQGANENFKPILVDKVDIRGVVIGVVRRY